MTEDLIGAAMSNRGIDAAPRYVTAFFDTDEAAERAQADLVAAGVPRGAVRVAEGQSTLAEPPHPHSFWESLKEFFLPDEDRHLYAEGLRRGGIALSVETDSAAYDTVLSILDRDGAVDLEERSSGWRDEGWTGTVATPAWAAEERAFTPPSDGTAGFGASMADGPLLDPPLSTGEIEPGLVSDVLRDRMAARAETPAGAYLRSAPGLDPSAAPPSPRPGEAQPAPALSRDVSHGRTRVRSYIGQDDPRDELDL